MAVSLVPDEADTRRRGADRQALEEGRQLTDRPRALAEARRRLRRLLHPALAVVTAFLIGAVVIVLTDLESLRTIGADPIAAIGSAIDKVVVGYTAMLTGGLGDPAEIVAAVRSGSRGDLAIAIWPLTEALVSATPFIFVSLGLAISFHAGLFNLGADGQFLMGGFGAGVGAGLLGGGLPPFTVLVGALAIGSLFGAAYGFVPGFLKARTGAHEVITTLMLNPIAPGVALLIGSLWVFSPNPAPIPNVPLLVDLTNVRLDWGFVVALLMAAVVSFLVYRTTLGFEVRATGQSRTAAGFAGMRPGRATVLAMVFSGGLAGMGGAFYALGPGGLFGGPPWDLGFTCLALALIAGLRPRRVVLVAVLFGVLNNGAKTMVIATGIPLALLTVIIALALMFIAAPGLIRMIWRVDVGPPASELTSKAQLGPADST